MVVSRFFFVLSLLVAFAWFARGCTSLSDEPVVTVARDTSWYPLKVEFKEKNLVAFSDDLVREVGKVSGFRMEMVRESSDRLLEGLHTKRFDAILVSMDASESNRDRYDLSSIYFQTGPVLVVPLESQINSIDDLQGATVGIHRETPSNFSLVREGLVVVTPFDNMVVGLESLIRGEVAAIIMNGMQAYSLIEGPYRSRLRIATGPLTVDGLRLVSLKGQQKELMEQFEATLRVMKADGSYQLLLRKWALRQ